MYIYDYIVYLLREILFKEECCLYFVSSINDGNKTCILLVAIRRVHVIYA